MASLTWWTWVWVNSGSLWWTGRPGVLQFMGSQRVAHAWATELIHGTEVLNWMKYMMILEGLAYMCSLFLWDSSTQSLFPKFHCTISVKNILSFSANSTCIFQSLYSWTFTVADTGDCFLFHSLIFPFVCVLLLFSHFFWTFHLRSLPRFFLLMLFKYECSLKINLDSALCLFQTFLEWSYPS